MTFRTASTLAGYARAAVEARIRQREYLDTLDARNTLSSHLDPYPGQGDRSPDVETIDVLHRATATA